jgi:hypothetical protein
MREPPASTVADVGAARPVGHYGGPVGEPEHPLLRARLLSSAAARLRAGKHHDHGVGEVARIEAACVDAWMERVTFKLQL